VDWTYSTGDAGHSSGLAAARFATFGMGFAASSWNVERSLVINAAKHDFTPTAFGLVFQRALALPVAPQTEPIPPFDHIDAEPLTVDLSPPLPDV